MPPRHGNKAINDSNNNENHHVTAQESITSSMLSSSSKLVSSFQWKKYNQTVNDEKYGKRKYQIQQQRKHLMVAIMAGLSMVGVTSLLLFKQQHQVSDAYNNQQAAVHLQNQRFILEQERQNRLRTHHHNAPKNMKDVVDQVNELRAKNGPSDGNNEEGGKNSGGFLQNFFGKSPEEERISKLLEELDQDIINNRDGGIRWSRPELLVRLNPNQPENPLMKPPDRRARKMRLFGSGHDEFFKVHRKHEPPIKWEKEWKEFQKQQSTPEGQGFGPEVDYTKHKYEYPPVLLEPPTEIGAYPPLRPMADLMEEWPQDDLDNPPMPYKEVLMHFNFSNPIEREAAAKFREAKLPFKVYDVPEVTAASLKWTDDYVALQFDSKAKTSPDQPIPASGTCQESPSNFFAFYTPPQWTLPDLGIPPTRTNDLTYRKWSEHARYADAVGLSPNQPHLYWQAGVDKGERSMSKDQWTFISRDLPSFSSPTDTFFVFHVDQQKGIQCRFGERGVTAATHYDAGRNMVAMVTGAKRYILSPPNQCSKLGIVTQRGHAIFRHSMLNFGHLNYMDNSEMSIEERAWLRTAGSAQALDTVLKAGEVLYIPSHWFHYITSLQKSAQCNVRSGIDHEGHPYFGGQDHVINQCEPFNEDDK